MLGWSPGLAAVAGLPRTRASTRRVTQLRLEQATTASTSAPQVQFELPTLVEEVLDKGIAIYFVAEAELYRERWYWTDRKVAQVARHMRLAYQPLTRRWRLNVSPVPITNAGFGVSLNQNFDTLADALDARSSASAGCGWATCPEIGDDAAASVMFRFRLDTSQLPRPFQIGVVGQADWNISVERSARLPLEKSK